MRIIAGEFGGRRLRAPGGSATRPTSSRVRESLFSHLQHRHPPCLPGANVLDLYAGSGALGIEAMSRGAARATFVDSGRPALASIRENLATLRIEDRSHVVGTDALRAVSPRLRGAPFDLVFADPPYADLAVDALARALADPAVCAPSCVWVLESGHDPSDSPAAGWSPDWSRRFGDTWLTVYLRDHRSG